MIKKILNTKLMDDSEVSGGGVWDLDIDPTALKEAANDYSKAVEAYQESKKGVIKAFNDIATNGSWQDISTGTGGTGDYQTKVKEIIDRLDAIETTLQKNSTNLTKIADYASSTESSVHSNVVTIA